MSKLEMTDSVIGFIGLGLIGGSIARRLKKVRPDLTIMAYMRTRSKLEQAKAEAVNLAVNAGAIRETVEIIEVEDVPLAYYAGNTNRVKIKAAGDLAN